MSTSKSSSALHPKDAKRAKRGPSASNAGGDEDWITRTASTLTLSRLEEKGQSWLAARHSSTSLTGADDGEDEEGYNNSAYDDPAWQRSRVQSQRGLATRLRLGNPRSRRSSAGGVDGVDDVKRGKEGFVGPDFVDVCEEEEGEEEGEDGGEEVDEGEMRRVVLGRVGGWVDWAVGWMDMRGEGEGDGDGDVNEDEDQGDGEVDDDGVRGELDLVELQKRLRRKKRRDEEAEGGTNGVDKPPEGEQAGVWSDAKWLLGVATKVAL